MVSIAIADGNVHAVNYFVAQKYVEALQTIGSAPNQKIMFMPVESAGLLGAVAGIGEIAREAMAAQAAKRG